MYPITQPHTDAEREKLLDGVLEDCKAAIAAPDPREGAPYDRQTVEDKLEATRRLLVMAIGLRARGDLSSEEYAEYRDTLTGEYKYPRTLYRAAEGDRNDLQ